MQVEIKKLPKSQVELNIAVEAREMEPFLNKAAKVLSREIKIDGFRLGKVPRPIIERKVGVNALWEEAVKIGLPHFLEKTFTEHRIEALGRPQVSIIKLAPNNPFIFKAYVAVMPEIVLGDYKKVKVKKPKVKKPTEEKIRHLIKKLQKMRAKFITVSRGARKGDRIEIDFQAYLKNNYISGGESKNHPFILGEGHFVAGFEEKLIGMKVAEEKKFGIRFPRDYFQKNLAGRLIRFKVKMNLVQRVELPKLNDEFVRTLGPRFTSLADLKKKSKANLFLEAQTRAQEKYELMILAKVCTQAQAEIPAVLIEYEKKKMLQELEYDVISQGGNFDDYLKSIQKTRENLKDGWEEKAQERVKTSLVLREIAKKENIKVGAKEIKTEINNILKNYPDLPEVRERFGNKAYQDYIRGMLRNRKVIKMLGR